ncbi:MAG: 6-carboxytetrahydropterin synthase QueD [Armatimonadetes bacterium]|nr:6-carboxytetrahydropterin synthase QueD [Armatimonadota bacterium]
MYELVVERHFSAAHFLPNYPGPCSRLHGHNFIVRAYVRGERLEASGMLVDFGVLKKALLGILEELDHHSLNELPAFAAQAPTTENIAYWIAQELGKCDLSGAHVHKIEVWETPGQAAAYYPID